MQADSQTLEAALLAVLVEHSVQPGLCSAVSSAAHVHAGSGSASHGQLPSPGGHGHSAHAHDCPLHAVFMKHRARPRVRFAPAGPGPGPSVRYSGIVRATLNASLGCAAAGRIAMGRLGLAFRPQGARHGPGLPLAGLARPPAILIPPAPAAAIADWPGNSSSSVGSSGSMASSHSSHGSQDVHVRRLIPAAVQAASSSDSHELGGDADVPAAHGQDGQGGEGAVAVAEERGRQEEWIWNRNPLHAQRADAVLPRANGQGEGPQLPVAPPALGHAPAHAGMGVGAAGRLALDQRPLDIVPEGLGRPARVQRWHAVARAVLGRGVPIPPPQIRPRPLLVIRAPPAASLAALAGHTHIMTDYLQRAGLQACTGLALDGGTEQGQEQTYLAGAWDCSRCSWSPLHFAAWGGHLETVHALLQPGTNRRGYEAVPVNVPARVQATAGAAVCTPLALAILHRSPSLVSLLLSQGARLQGAWRYVFSPVLRTQEGLDALLLLAEQPFACDIASSSAGVAVRAGVVLPRLSAGAPGGSAGSSSHLLAPVLVLLHPWAAAMDAPAQDLAPDAAAVLSLLVTHVREAGPPGLLSPALVHALTRTMVKAIGQLDEQLVNGCLEQLIQLGKEMCHSQEDCGRALHRSFTCALLEVCRCVRLATLTDLLRPVPRLYSRHLAVVDAMVAHLLVQWQEQARGSVDGVLSPPWTTLACACDAAASGLAWVLDPRSTAGMDVRAAAQASVHAGQKPRLLGSVACLLYLITLGSRLITAAQDVSTALAHSMLWTTIRDKGQLGLASLSYQTSASREGRTQAHALLGVSQGRKMLLPCMLPRIAAPTAVPLILRLWYGSRAWRTRRHMVLAFYA